jgi:type IV pilus assembly protein PilB
MNDALIDKVCEVLLKNKSLSEADLARARSYLSEKGGKLWEVFLKMSFVNRKTLLAAFSEVSGYRIIDLARINIDVETLKMIPKRISMMYQVIPVSRMGNILVVAMVDPANIFAIDDLKAITKLNITPLLADSEDIKEAIVRCYDRSADEEISDIVGDLAESAVEMVSGKEEEMSSGELLRIMEETPVIKLTNMILSQAVKEGASDVMIEPMEKDFRVRYRLDGMLHIRHTPQKKYHAALISRLKVMSNLNIAERRLPQDGRFKLKVEDRHIDFRLSIIPSIMGEKASLRILDKEQVTVDIAKLGMMERDQKVICEASEVPHGMLLVCGPTGSGKTTTLYSILKHVDNPGENLVTVEDPVEFEMKGINQVSVNTPVGLTFASSLRSILRQDPDTIMIGEMRDLETVDIAIKSALTGHLVLSTLHTNTAAGSIVRMVNMGVEPFLIASSTVLVVAQRLVRKLCTECRQTFQPSQELADRYEIFDKNGKIPLLYKPKGCKRCLNSGYRGRIAIVECMRVTPAIKELLFNRASEAQLETAARKEGMVTLRHNGLENAILGITSLEEVLRTTADSRKME